MSTKQILRNSRKLLAIAVTALLILAAALLLLPKLKPASKEPQIITQSFLQEVTNVSYLSSFEAVYNGIAQGKNADNPEQTDYHVSYNAKIKAGFDFDAVKITVNEEEKDITVTIPPIRITDITVDITSLDYIFENDKSNAAMISQEAYKVCIEDATTEGNAQKEIFNLAEQNAENIIKALIEPFVKQLDAEYTLQIIKGGN